MNTIQQTQDKLPRELRAVLHIFNYDEELRAKALPYVNVARQSINWPGIWQNDFSGGHAAAVVWAQAIWCDRVETKSDPFDRAFAMDSRLQVSVLEALAIRWGFAPQKRG
jgi:hypothetical protein